MSTTFTTIHDACVALQQGKTSKIEFLSYAKSRQHNTEPLLSLFQKQVLTMAEISEIITEQQKLAAKGKTSQARGLSFKVSEKGACSVYGLQRMPVTLYIDQWERLLKDEVLTELRQFFADNSSKLSRKPAKA